MSSENQNSANSTSSRVIGLAPICIITQIIIVIIFGLLAPAAVGVAANFSRFEYILMSILGTTIYFTIPNIGLLSLLNFTRILPSAVKSRFIQVTTISIVLITHHFIQNIADSFPNDVRMINTSEGEFLRMPFWHGFLMIYTYVTVFLSIFVYSRIKLVLGKRIEP